MADNLKLETLHVASDCKVVVDDIKSRTLGIYSFMVKVIVDRALFFQSCNFVFESRLNNFEAHNLAKFASSLGIVRHVRLGTLHDVITVPLNIIQ